MLLVPASWGGCVSGLLVTRVAYMLQVGHNALGAGQVIDQGARLVDKAVQVQAQWFVDCRLGCCEHPMAGRILQNWVER